jgi:CRP/FNR family transcriptional regulator, anaerobic regulatory protein
VAKFDAPAASHPGHQCDHCLVRRTGLCNAFADGGGLALRDLEAAHFTVRVFDAGDIIYSQGDSADYLFNVVSGWVDLHQDMPDGRRHISQFLLPGGLFGVKPKGLRYSHGATTITTASICAIPTARVDSLRRLHPAFNERFIWMLEQENHAASEALTMIGQGTSLERVARILWGLATRISSPAAIVAGVGLKAPLTQRLIADATGLTAIHVNRVIRRLREQHLVAFHNGIMIVEDPGRLAALANEGPESAAHWSAGGGAIQGPPPGKVALGPRKGPIADRRLEDARKLQA